MERHLTVRAILFSLLFTLNVFALDLSGLPAPYNSLTTLLPMNDQRGYASARQMERMLRGKSIHTVIEISSGLGVSTRHIARLLPGDGKVYVVNPFESSESQAQGLPTLYEQFLSNVVHSHLENMIIPIRMASLDVAQALIDVKPDLIYFDGGHETEIVYANLLAWFPYVAGKQGVLCGDDWHWASVRVAVDQFARENLLVIYAADNFWWLEEQ